MIKSTFIQTLKDRFQARPAGDTSLDSIIERQFDAEQVLLEKSGRRFSFQLTEASLDVDTASATPQIIALPSDYLIGSYIDEPRLYRDSDDTLVRILGRRPLPELEKNFDENRVFPYYYDQVGTNLYLYPYAQSDHTLKFFYHQSASLFSALGTGAENYWLANAAPYFLGKVGQILAAQVLQVENSATLLMFQQQLSEGITMLEHYEAAQEQDNFDYSMEQM